MFNKIILVGNLSRDVELKYTPSGTAIANFGIATNRTYKDASGQQEQEVMFIDVKVFGRSAEIANQYLHKGKRVLVEGRLAQEQWVDRNGQKRSKHVVIAEKVQFMDTKSSNGEANQARDYGQSANYVPPQSNNNQANLPHGIDEEGIPF